jgi:hypothetical protein
MQSVLSSLGVVFHSGILLQNYCNISFTLYGSAASAATILLTLSRDKYPFFKTGSIADNSKRECES